MRRRTPTTSPRMISAGAPTRRSATVAGSSARGAVTVRCCPGLPEWTPAPSVSGGVDHGLVDGRPALGVTARQLIDAHAPDRGRRVFEQPHRHEAIVEDEVGLAQALDGAQGEEPRMAGAGADQRNGAGLHSTT